MKDVFTLCLQDMLDTATSNLGSLAKHMQKSLHHKLDHELQRRVQACIEVKLLEQQSLLKVKVFNTTMRSSLCTPAGNAMWCVTASCSCPSW
jgi:hypothetical protein